MFGSQPRTRRPLLLILVFGAFLAIIGITATAQAVDGLAALLDGHAEHDRRERFGHGPGRPQPLAAAARPGSRDRPDRRATRPRSRTELAALTGPGEILRVELRRLDGTIVAASEPALAGLPSPPGGPADGARPGQPSVELVAGRRCRGRPRATSASPTRPAGVPADQHRRPGPRRRRDLARRGCRSSPGSTSVRRDVVLVTLSAAIVAAVAALPDLPRRPRAG